MRQGDWLAQQLPAGMLEDEFLLRFVRIFQDVADTVFDQLDTLPFQFDAHTAPLPMVRLLGRWLGLRVDSSVDADTQRRLVIVGARELPWRGTERALRAMLEVITGGGPIVIKDSGGVYAEDEPMVFGRPRHVIVRVDAAGILTERDLADFIRAELPAEVTFDLVVAGRAVRHHHVEAEEQALVAELEEVA